MPYSKFTLPELRKKFGLQAHKAQIFENVITIEPSAWLKETLQKNSHISLLSEKARSELIVTPILTELLSRNNFSIGLYSGVQFDVDETKGLNGECDFIIGLQGNSYTVESPIIALVEAKDDDISSGIPQCSAQMFASFEYNQAEGNFIDTIYGCVTTGTEWQFLQLKDNKIFINNTIIQFSELSKLLGIWQLIVEFYKK